MPLFNKHSNAETMCICHFVTKSNLNSLVFLTFCHKLSQNCTAFELAKILMSLLPLKRKENQP